MADDFFKVRNGFTVGEDIFTVDGTTGDVVVTGDLTVQGDNIFTGDLAVNGGDITTTALTASVFDTTATTVNIGSAATTMSIGSGAGTVTIPGNLTVNGTTTTINTQDLLVEDKNITMGNVAVPTDITASGGGITLLGDTNKTITWNNSTDGWEFNQPIKVTGDVVLSGNITDTGALQISTSANGAITLAPNGTGNTVITTNLVRGSVRQSGPIANGDVWGTGATGTSNTSRGISIDNTGNTAKRNSVVLRGYNNQRSSMIGEMASGSVASPAVPGAGFTIVEMAATGYNGGGADGWVSSQGGGYTGRAYFATGETWTSTSTGTNFLVGVCPTGYVGIVPQVLALNPVAGQTNTDTFTFVSKVPAAGGTAATQMTVTEALVSTAGDLKVGGNDIQASDGNTNITLTSNTLTSFAGDIKVGGNDIQASDGTTALTLSSTTGNVAVTGNLDVLGGTITESTGALTISTGASNGNITLDPNGTGNVVLTFADGGNLTNDRNYVSGIIRIPATASAGDIYGYNLGTTNPYRGISIDNTASSTTTTGKRTGLVMRNYANAPRNSIIGESARGTNPSSPLILTNNSNLVEMVGNGYAATSDGTGFQATGCTISGTTLTIGTVTAGAPAVGQLISSITYPNVVTAGTTITANISGSGSGSTWTVSASQTVASSTIWGGGDGWIASNNGVPAGLRFQAFENWTTQTSGTGMIVTLSPLAATNGIAGAGFNALSMSLSSTTLASDSQTFRTRPAGAGGTNFAMLSLTESLATVGGDLRVNGNDIQASDGNTNITLTSNTLTTLAGDLQINGNDIQNSAGQTSYAMTSDRSNTSINTTAMNFNTTSGSNMVNFTATGTQGGFTFSDPNGSGNNVLMEVGATKSVYALYGVSADGSVTPTVNYNGYRRVSGNNVATLTNDRLGQFTFNGNINTGTGGPSSNVVGGEIRVYATEDWTNTQAGTGIALEITKQGTNTNTNVFISSGVQTEITGDTIVLKDTSGSNLVGNKISYNRVYGQWQYDSTITAAASNTAYAFPMGTQDYANIASVVSTSRLTPGALGMYKTQFSVQVANDDNASDHTAYIWWRKNGTDIPGSMGRVTVAKASAVSGAVIAGWDNMIEVTNVADYFELMYATDNATHITFPAYGTTAFGPSTAALFTTLVPIGA